MTKIKPCRDCSIWEHELQRASEYCARLSLKRHQMTRDGRPDRGKLEKAILKAKRRRAATAKQLLSHLQSHDQSSAARLPAGTGAVIDFPAKVYADPVVLGMRSTLERA